MDALLERITFNKDVLSGKPLIRGLRISVETILDLLAKGVGARQILEDYPELEAEDIRAALLYAHNVIESPERIAGDSPQRLRLSLRG
jgi:uncharacterized protein (DUF433 family)